MLIILLKISMWICINEDINVCGYFILYKVYIIKYFSNYGNEKLKIIVRLM